MVAGLVRRLSIVLIGCFLILAIFSCNNKTNETAESEDNWIELFNGVDLKGWYPKVRGFDLGENPYQTFRAEDGILKVSYDQYDEFNDRFGHIFYETPYSDYRLKLEYRFTGEQAKGGLAWATKNSGIMLHCQPPESMAIDQAFPVSLEAQLLGGLEAGLDRPTANLCTPGTHVDINGKQETTHCINSSSETFYGEEWIEVEIIVYHDSLIKHLVNGKEVISYSKPVIGGEYNTLEQQEGKALISGYISLQSESHPIEFRNIRLLNLKN